MCQIPRERKVLMVMGEADRIPATKMAAWVGFVHAHARIMGQLAADLDQAGQIPLGTYDVLVQLSEAGGSLRHRDLLDRLVVSQPGLSRRVERLESAGLVERRPDPADGRGVIVRLSRSGRATLRNAAKIHMAGIHREFAGQLTDHEAEVLSDVFARLSSRHAAGADSVGIEGLGAAPLDGP